MSRRRDLLLLSAILAVAVLVRTPGLDTALRSDDAVIHAYLSGDTRAAPFRSVFDLYHFHDPDPLTLNVPVRACHVGWWLADHPMKLAFLRPLSSALMALDHRLFGPSPVPLHVHSLLWFFLFLGAMVALGRRLVPGPIAWIAALVCAVEETGFRNTSWWCNRHQLVAVAPVLWALVAYVDDSRAQRRWPGARVLAPLALGLLGGEAAIPLIVLFIAYELVSTEGSVRDRLRRLAPVLALAAAYLAARVALGYGVAHVDAYIDPLGDPGGFGRHLVHAFPIAVGNVIGNVDVTWRTLRLHPTEHARMLLGGALTVALGGLLLAARRYLVREERRAVLACLIAGLGALGFSVIKVEAISTLLVPTLCFSIPIAAVVVAGGRAVRGLRLGAAPLVLGALALAACHIVVAPLLLVRTTRFLAHRDESTMAPLRRVLAEPRAASTIYIELRDALNDWPMATAELLSPKRRLPWCVLAPTERGLELTRDRADGFELAAIEGPLVAGAEQAVGTRIALDPLEVTVLARSPEGVTRIGARFTGPLDAVVLLARDGEQLREIPLPALGASTMIAR